MRLITRRTIERFAETHADARDALATWCTMVEVARWLNADHLASSSTFPARPIGNKRVVFNIKGNAYRVICSVRYAAPEQNLMGIVKVHFVGTHAEYDRVDADTVDIFPA